jgi:hypothetical protein
MADIIETRNYDFSKIPCDESVMKYILGDRWTLEAQKIMIEKDRQIRILDKCKNELKGKYLDDYSINQLSIRSYSNYYLVHILGMPFKEVDFIYDKMEMKVLDSFFSYGCIDCIDSYNFFLIRRDRFGNMESAYHFQLRNNQFNMVNSFYGVHTNILPLLGDNFGIPFGNLVSWNGNAFREKGVLYNYKKAEMVVPEFTEVQKDYGDFSDVYCHHLIRVINQIKVGKKVTNLEFLIDEEGCLFSDVYDFQNNVCYIKEDYGINQVEALAAIYHEVELNMQEENKSVMVRKREKNTYHV